LVTEARNNSLDFTEDEVGFIKNHLQKYNLQDEFQVMYFITFFSSDLAG
jgi:hypothetical protein